MLGRGSVFEGKLAFEGTVHIDGTFTGEIHSKDTLIIGDGAKVEGDIDVGTLIIHGEVTGHLRARQVLELQGTARVKGTVLTPSLVVARGAIFEGTTKMENLDAPLVTQPAPPRALPTA
jgi:cytoskeletal protein CcmA (bactofilin family)